MKHIPQCLVTLRKAWHVIAVPWLPSLGALVFVPATTLIAPVRSAEGQFPVVASQYAPLVASRYESTTFLALPQSSTDQKWLITLGGVAVVNEPGGFRGINPPSWAKGTLRLRVPNFKDALQQVPNLKVPDGYERHLQVKHWTGLATLNSIADAGHSVDAGFAADNYTIQTYGVEANAEEWVVDTSGKRLPDVFKSFDVDLAARDYDAVILRVGYSLTLYGTPVVGKRESICADLIRRIKVSQARRYYKEYKIACVKAYELGCDVHCDPLPF